MKALMQIDKTNSWLAKLFGPVNQFLNKIITFYIY